MILDTLFNSFAPIWAKKWQFLGVFLVITTITYGVLYAIDFIPEAPEETVTPAVAAMDADTEEEVVVVEEPRGEDATPDRIIFDSLNKDVAILNPSVATVAALDQALLSGVVRHPDSATLLQEGTVFLFGHSSYLPTVINKNFQAFNGINKLEWGDKIRVQSSDFEYVYRVDRVYQVKASTAEVKIATEGQRLTLVTCNTFGAKEDRYVVEAMLVDSFAL